MILYHNLPIFLIFIIEKSNSNHSSPLNQLNQHPSPLIFVADLSPTYSAWSVAKPSALHASLLLGPNGEMALEMALEIYRMGPPR
jgi:hypothetical protein